MHLLASTFISLGKFAYFHRSTTGIRPGGVRSAEGLVGPMLDGTMISVEDFECVESSNPDAMCSIASQDMEEAVTYVRQWAHTLAYGAEVREIE